MKELKTTDYPLVSIVTVNYNNADMTRGLLQSLRNITYQATEVIVVDNASSDNAYKDLIIEFPDTKFLRSNTNLGYAGGINLGFGHAQGDLLLSINNDVEVSPFFLEPMVSMFLNNPEAGMASPKILFDSEPQRIQYAGSTGINPWTGRGKKVGYMNLDCDKYDYIAETSLVHGACMMVSRQLIETIGLIPEEYFLYYEEHDWAESTKRAGFKLYYVGSSVITHKASGSVGANSPLKTYYMNRSRLMFIRRNSTGLKLITSTIFYVLLAIPKNCLFFLINRDTSNFKAFIKALIWHFDNGSVWNRKIRTYYSAVAK
ncbi:MAG: glycosyltransferase family 2 protein [Marinoscillum sp.]